MSLGELGARLEFSIHNRMHMRFCGESEMRPDVDPGSPDSIPARWDDPVYDWLGDTYSSHVNPVFWKLHGWVDDRITDWLEANGVVGPPPWKTGTPWVGDMPHGHEHEEPHLLMALELSHALPAEDHSGHGHKMDQAVEAVLQSGRFHHFYDPVEFPD